jgi:ketosteroid isomerase-like protein
MKEVKNMRRTLFSALMLCLMAIPSILPEAQEESEADKVRALEVKLMDCYKQRQLDLLASLLDKDFVITVEDGSIYGKTGYISYSASSSMRVDIVEMSDLKIRLHGDTAVLTGAYHERGETKGQPYDYHDRFTDVWMKKSGKWRLIASHYAVPGKQ